MTGRVWGPENHPVCTRCTCAAPIVQILRDRVSELEERAEKQQALRDDAAVVYHEVRPPDVEGARRDAYNEAIDDAVEEIRNPDWRDSHDTNLRMAGTILDLKR